MILPCIVVWK